MVSWSGDRVVRPRRPLVERFAAKVNTEGPIPAYAPALGPCWLWVGAQDGHGYGSFHKDGRTARAHRVSYELHVGPIPDGLPLDHLCRVPLCVRPTHLEPVTHMENARRGVGGWLATHCVHGHQFTPANTRITPQGHRRCRRCHREAMRGAR